MALKHAAGCPREQALDAGARRDWNRADYLEKLDCTCARVSVPRIVICEGCKRKAELLTSTEAQVAHLIAERDAARAECERLRSVFYSVSGYRGDL